MDRRETVELFRERLSEVIAQSGHSRSAFASRAGLDRSTLSQLLSDSNDRLPRAETIAAIAARAQVSVDWLLGLSQEAQSAGMLAESMEIAAGAASPADERLRRWQSEATGYKIRYVPTTIPDLLKTEAVIAYEFREQGQDIHDTQLGQAEERLAYSRRPETDIEACTSFQAVEEFARGQGVWRDLAIEERKLQMSWMMSLIDELYPTFRWFLYDGLNRYSAPYTIFGPKRAAIYLGNMYFVFTATEHIRALTRHFDDLIRAAVVQPPDVLPFLEGLLAEMEEFSS